MRYQKAADFKVYLCYFAATLPEFRIDFEGQPPKERPNPAGEATSLFGALCQGANGLRLRDRKTERLARRVRGTLRWLEASDFPAVSVWAEFEILATQVFAVLRAGSIVNANGEGKRLLDDYRKLRLAQRSTAANSA